MNTAAGVHNPSGRSVPRRSAWSEFPPPEGVGQQDGQAGGLVGQPLLVGGHGRAQGEMADQLRQLPDIGVYGRLRLRDLAQRGPASARGIWATAKDALSQDYGNVTIDDLLGEFQALQK